MKKIQAFEQIYPGCSYLSETYEEYGNTDSALHYYK